MPHHTIEQLRNIALVGHTGSGKTSLVEALLHQAGVVASPGSVERGTTVCDFDPLEKSHRHSLNTALVHFPYRDTRINLIDTPGYPDFIGQTLSVLPAVETAACVVNAQNGVELVTQRVMAWAARHTLCRIVVVNKIDAENVDLTAMLTQIQEAFGKECLPINLPSSKAAKVVDCFFNPAGEADFSTVNAAHTALVDQVVELDEDLMALYLEQGQVSPEQLHAPFEKALRDGHLIPVCFVSTRTGAGVGELLNIIEKLMPNPTEGNPPRFLKGEGEQALPIQAVPDPARHVLAHVFKITVDPFVGKLGVLRVHQGTVRRDSQLYIGNARKPFKVGHLLLLRGKDHVDTDIAIPGDICAIPKIEEMHFDAVLHDSADDDHIHLAPLELPVPVFGLAVEPKRRGDEQKLSDALHKLAAEDPCFRMERNTTTNETVILGLGEMHLRCMLEKMQEHYHAEVTTRPPRIAYRETISARAEGHHRHKKQTGGAGQFGEVFLRVEPLPRGAGFEFSDQIHGGTIPSQFVPAVEKGVRQALESGIVAGYPVHDVRVIVYDGKYHPVDSKEVAFVAAGKKAFMDAVLKAGPVIMEPIVNLEVITPETYMGDITGDLSARRGQISGSNNLRGGNVAITGLVPLSELENYQARLKSVTGGHGSYTLTLSHYERVPPHVQQQLCSHYNAAPEE
ncbi:MAG: elongation factor G [Burkholderiales bacterium]